MFLLPHAAPPPDHRQLVATLGPASLDRAAALAAAGATAFRLNASHMAADALATAVDHLARELPGCPVVVDLQGAKMRLGALVERTVERGERLRFTDAAGPEAIPLPHPELFASARTGDTISNDDDRLRFRVERVAPDELEAICVTGGRLRQRTGVNLVEHPVVLEDLTAADSAKVAALARHHGPGLAFAFSFIASGDEAAWIRRRAPGSPVIAKIERREAVAALPGIEAACDAVWICRGDLGAQLGAAGLARFVAGLDPRRSAPQPVLMAGQVLEHLTRHPVPTRSEVCHLYDLLARGYAGIVLSDETAIGDDPERAVRTAAGLLAELGSAHPARR